jgi:hypothetical protein
MPTTRLAPLVIERAGHRRTQSEALVDLTEQQDTAIAGDVTALEIGFDATPF